MMSKFCSIEAQIQLGLRLGSFLPAKQSKFETLNSGTQSYTRSNDQKKKEKEKTTRIQNSAEPQGLPRFEVRAQEAPTHPTTFLIIFFLENPTQILSPLPLNPVSRYSWCIGSYEHKQMLQRNLFLLLNCSKHVSVFLALGMFWCAHKL